jgi:hypothetical protein
VGFCKSLDFTNGKRVGSRKEEFDIIEAGFFRESERLGKRLAENEGACGGFRNLAKCDCGAHKILKEVQRKAAKFAKLWLS